MLAGRGPFLAPTPISVAMKHLHDPIPSMLSLRSDLPADVDRILHKALAKDREARYVCATDFANELRELVDRLKHEGNWLQRPIQTPTDDGQVTEIDNEYESSPARSAATTQQPVSTLDIPRTPTSNTQRKKSTGPRLAWGLGGLGLCLLAACGLASMLGVGSWFGIPGLFPGLNRTAEARSTLVSTIDPQETVLFSDDFSNPSTGWPTLQNSQGSYSYEADGYHIAVDETDAVLWAKTSESFTNSTIRVDAQPLEANRDGYYGVLCRIQNDRSFYYFVILNSGEYTVGKYKNGGFESLTQGWRQSDSIQTNTEPNRIQADCDGNQLRLHVNDVLLEEVTDTEFRSGASGLLSASLDTRRFEVLFNNVVITEPDR
jgi:hypothetical protein